MRSMGDGWEVWIDWYQDMIDGKPADEETQLQIALIPEETWKQGAKAVNAQVARILAPDRSRSFSESDFAYNPDSNTIDEIPFDEDRSKVPNDYAIKSLAELLNDLRDVCREMIEDIVANQSQVPSSFSLDLERYASEAAEGDETIRPGKLQRLGNNLLRAAGSEDLVHGLGPLQPKLADITRMHLQTLRQFYPGMLERMAPLADADLDASPEEADEKIAAAVEALTTPQDEPLPAMPQEFLDSVAEERATLTVETRRLMLVASPEERAARERDIGQRYVSLSATVARLVYRTLEAVDDIRTSKHGKAVAGGMTVLGLAGALASLLGLF